MGSEPLSADGHAATAAMLAVLSHQDVARRVDERLFEALLAYTLNSVPGLPGDLFGITARNFGFGKRPKQPDVVGYHGEDPAVGIEVKIHSNLSFPGGRCQLDNYADGVPAARLFIIAPDERVTSLVSGMGSEEHWTESRHRWEMLTLSRLHETLVGLTGLRPVSEDPAARLILALARLI